MKALLNWLEKADLAIRPNELLFFQSLSAVLCLLTTLVLFDGFFKSLIGLVVGIVWPLVGIWWWTWRRFHSLESQFDEALLILEHSLREGYSLVRGIEVVSRFLPPPISTEFKTILVEVQCGLPFEQSLHEFLRRFPHKDLKKLALITLIQRNIGGNLADVIGKLYFERLEQNIRKNENLLSIVKDSIEIFIPNACNYCLKRNIVHRCEKFDFRSSYCDIMACWFDHCIYSEH